ncbi:MULTISPECIES: GntR family transcriptional regulator [Tenebrionibacter/Tenebrionicola group]|jgi:DNA-binding GntR family transcriptional regulator|uniref:GntR family transcriptional regulator n=2 Tax=Tenebrionibacter/Tenebrionicola group TaxID=2969848 RepID=A0A8K0V3Y1_9ENTR|nr:MULTISPECIES: GntR family transcriptional regulator [Tenebrionibacter/Tenebrionicola group]MBK4714973.1 GntR family transcriptional regulator [Tenebrionibacter intestinalis]MBV5095686.1 GntR family transcriptional regulator [Tenebrionicola larvae]
MKEELDYSRGAKPLYAQLYDILLGKLKTGEYKKNDVLPTEAEFEEIFGVSRITARRALAELAAKGLVKRQAGIGTMVISALEKQEVKARVQLVDGQQQHPIERKNLRLEQRLPPPDVAKAFGLDDKTPLFLLTRTIYRQNTQPAQVNYIWLTSRLHNLSLASLSEGLYNMLEKYGENIESFQDVITAELPTQEDCRILNICSAEPMLVKTRKGYNARAELVEFGIARHIASSYQYVVENSR